MPDVSQEGHFPQRLIFMIQPPLEVALLIHAFAASLIPCSPRRADLLHITMAISDDFHSWRGDYVERLLCIGDRIEMAPFRISLDRVMANGNMVLLPGAGLEELRVLQGHLAENIRSASVAIRKQWRFSPHLTLLYNTAARFELPISAFEWEINKLVLVRSHVGSSRHERLASWDLHAGEVRQLSLF